MFQVFYSEDDSGKDFPGTMILQTRRLTRQAAEQLKTIHEITLSNTKKTSISSYFV